MALVTRYFDVSGAGSQDGTDYDNRAPLIVTGAFNTIIRNFAFNGSDALECILEPGTYSGLTTNMTFTNAPSTSKQLFFRVRNFTPPRWVSSQPFWNKDKMARIQSSSNIYLGVANTNWYGISVEFSNRSGAIFPNAVQRLVWCLVENSTNSTSALCYGSAAGFVAYCSGFKCSGTSYDSVVLANNSIWENCRFEGNPNASSGNRRGFSSTATPSNFVNCTICGNVGDSIILSAATGNISTTLINCVVHGSGNGLVISSSNTTISTRVYNSFIISGSGNGINVLLGSNSIYKNNRIRSSGTPIVNQIDFPSIFNDTSSGSDSQEFVDAPNGDFRIKRSSVYWGKYMGCGDEPPLNSYGYLY